MAKSSISRVPHCIVIAAFVGFSAPSLVPAASAQVNPASNRPVPSMSAVNCDALNQGTLICVRNATPDTIVKITCSGFWGSSDLSIPRGVIHSGETTIVDFAKSKCNKHIVVFTRDGHQLPFDGFDTTENTTLEVDRE